MCPTHGLIYAQVPIDAGSLAEPFFAPDAKAFMHDAKAFGALSHSVKVDAAMAGQYDAVCLCGGHGTCVAVWKSIRVTRLDGVTQVRRLLRPRGGGAEGRRRRDLRRRKGRRRGLPRPHRAHPVQQNRRHAARRRPRGHVLQRRADQRPCFASMA